MILDFDDFVIWMYVTVDDCWQVIAPLYQRPGPPPTTCSDSELITIALVSELCGWDRETHWDTHWKPYRYLFPRLPERSRLNRRRRNLWLAVNHIRQVVLTMMDIAFDGQGVVDSLPLPVLTFHLVPQRTRAWDAHGATFGYCASKQQYYFGFRLHLVVTLGGLIVDFVLTSADTDERPVAEQMLRDRGGGTYFGDKGYIDDPLAERLRTEVGVALIALRRTNQRRQLDPELRRQINRVRQIIETVNSQLVEQLHIQRNHAHTFWGFCTRLYTKLAAHTLSIAINRWLGNPDWLQIAQLIHPS